MTKIDWPVCATLIRVSGVNIGQKGRCEKCNSKFIVPEHAGQEVEILERGKLPMKAIDCPVCSTMVKVSWGNIGEKGRCGSCNSKFIVPLRPGEEVELLERGEFSGGKMRRNPVVKPAIKATRGTALSPKTGKQSTAKAPVKEVATVAGLPATEAKQAEDAGVTGKFKTTSTSLGLRVRSSEAKATSPAVAIGIVCGCILLVISVVLFTGGEGDDRAKNTSKDSAVVEVEKPINTQPGEVKNLPEPEPEQPVFPGSVAHFDKVIHPLLNRYCIDCHDGVSEEGGVNMERFGSEREALSDPDMWELAADLLEMGEMPPRNKRRQPTAGERKQIIAWINTVSERWDAGALGRDPGRTTIRRLNKNEYNYTVRDLFGFQIRPADDFPEDGGGEAGFDNNADALFLPPLLMENYVESAGVIVHAVYRNQALYTKYLFAFPAGEVKPDEAARQVLSRWASKAYRRPAGQGEVERLVKIFRLGIEKKKQNYREAMKLPLLAILISPNFLYRAENIRPGKEVYRVDDFDLASRLSYFIWSSMPDSELFTLAGEGRLGEPEVLQAQVKRMLGDEKAKSLSMHFAGQWFKWEELRSRTNPDREKFPVFDFELRVSLYRESSLFFENMVRENRSILDLIDSDYTYLNPRLGRHYGIEGVSGSGFRKVALKDPNRGGVIGMGSVLSATSLPLRTSPSVRGAYVLTELLGTPPPSPPMDVPQLPEDDRQLKAASFRQELIDHRFIPACKACHERIDPIGFGLENFDAIGRWRTSHNGRPLDTSGELPDGTSFSSPESLKKILMGKRDLFTRNMVEKTLSYALGRELSPYDRQTVKAITNKVIAGSFKAHVLFSEVVGSFPFLHCRGDSYAPH